MSAHQLDAELARRLHGTTDARDVPRYSSSWGAMALLVAKMNDMGWGLRLFQDNDYGTWVASATFMGCGLSTAPTIPVAVALAALEVLEHIDYQARP